jgi:hypothetical protein
MFLNRRFYIVNNDQHVIGYSPLMLGRPVIKLGDFSPLQLIPLKITTPDSSFVFNMPVQTMRTFFDSVYRFRVQDPDPTSNEVVYNVASPAITARIGTSYPVFLKVLQNVATFNPYMTVDSGDGTQLTLLSIIDKLLSKMIKDKGNA